MIKNGSAMSKEETAKSLEEDPLDAREDEHGGGGIFNVRKWMVLSPPPGGSLSFFSLFFSCSS